MTLCSLMPSSGSCICVAHIPSSGRESVLPVCNYSTYYNVIRQKYSKSIINFAADTFCCNITLALLLLSVNENAYFLLANSLCALANIGNYGLPK